MSLMNDDPSGFEVTTSFEGQRAVLALHGRVESVAAFDLWAALSAAIDLHRQEVVLDLSGLDFIGAAGLVALANAEKSFAEARVGLTIRTPSPLLRQFLGATSATEMDHHDGARAGSEHLGAEQVGEPTHPFLPPIPPNSTVDLRGVIAHPKDFDVVDAALSLIVQLARISVKGADGVSISLVRHGELMTVAASDQTVMEMDADQYATGEGPCVDASRQGHWFHAESLDAETRWPSFTPQARALGIMAILSSPLTASEQAVGALNIYSRTASTFDVEAQRTAADFARKASEILRDAHAGPTGAHPAARFQEALRGRDAISTAKGIVMERDGLNEDDAFTNLLRQSIKSGVSLLARAEGLVRSTEQPRSASDRKPDD